MRILLAFGNKSEEIKETLGELDDSIDLLAYERVSELIENITILRLDFERIILTPAGVKTKQEMVDLNSFLRTNHPRATVVFMFPKDKEKAMQKAESFIEIFNSPLYTDLGVSKNSISILQASARDSVDEIREKYSINKYDTTDGDLLEDDYVEEESEELKEAPKEAEVRPMVTLPQRKRQHKRYGFFGLKKLNKMQMQTKQQNLEIAIAFAKYLNGDVDSKVESIEQETLNQGILEGNNPNNANGTGEESLVNLNNEVQEQSKNLSNLTPSRTFTELEFGYYNFINNFKGRPMVAQEGSGYKQVYK
ncbi:hypothetical protein P9X10_00435 [Bacillus cereus]|nr:hypothetical protein [Bacillus cereus]